MRATVNSGKFKIGIEAPIIVLINSPEEGLDALLQLQLQQKVDYLFDCLTFLQQDIIVYIKKSPPQQTFLSFFVTIALVLFNTLRLGSVQWCCL